MNELNMINSIKESQESGVRLDFADLLRRIEADGGESTAPCTMRSSNAARYVGAAAGIVAVAAISVTALVGISSSAKYAMDAAPMEPSAPAEAPDMMASDEEYMYSYSESEENASGITVDETQDTDAEIVSDGDVSDSDVSGSDAQEVD